MTEKVYRAGMVLYNIEGDGQLELLMMIPSDTTYGGDQPQLPKGKVEEGETAEQAALREAAEEVGLIYSNIVDGVTHLGSFLGRTDVFVAKVFDKDMFKDYSNETSETIWMTPEEFYNNGRPLHVPVVKAAVRLIEAIEE